jgi:adenine-specific DNA-methyltransferase
MVNPGVDARALTLAFHSSLTLLSLEVEGRSYGGGILKLEPTEMARVRVPWPLPDDRTLARIIAGVDHALRSEDYVGAVKMVDEDLLVKQLGMPRDLLSLLGSGRRRLLERRLKRARSVA